MTLQRAVRFGGSLGFNKQFIIEPLISLSPSEAEVNGFIALRRDIVHVNGLPVRFSLPVRKETALNCLPMASKTVFASAFAFIFHVFQDLFHLPATIRPARTLQSTPRAAFSIS